MPTGYTAEIASDISFKQYAMCCARAFGALIEMRDEPFGTEIPESFEPSSYHRDALQESIRVREELLSLTDKQKAARSIEANKAALESHETCIKNKNNLRIKYELMLTEVNAWKPPTADHVKFKKFMIDQINISIEGDCSIGGMEKPKELSPEAWHKKALADAEWHISYHQKEWEKEVERTNGRNNWISALRESLA